LTDCVKVSVLTDFELIQKTKDGYYPAFNEIVKRHKAKIAATINGMIGKCYIAEDIGQEVFIRFYKSINSFRGDSALSTYLTRIAINLTLNEIKRRKLRRFLSFDTLLEEGTDIITNIDNNDNKEIIWYAIQKLSPKYRSVLVLRLMDEYSTEETAKILELPIGTVLSRLARAQIKLKEYLKQYLLEL
jgi:RNA polymerase sigma-70 factor, ECF subfamily